MSQLSATDAEIFRRLANPQVVHLETRTRRAAAEMRTALEKATEKKEDETVEAGAASPTQETAKQSAFRLALEQQRREEPRREEPQREEPRREEELHAPEDGRLRPDERRPEEPRTSEERRMPEEPRTSEERRAPEERREEERRARPKEGEGERLEKQGFLIELAALEAKGVQLSRRFSMEDSLAEMEFEHSKQSSHVVARNTVGFMRDTMRVVINGVEVGNARFGPFLSIDGWAQSVTADMSRYDNALERIYRQYWRRSSMSPLAELAWLVLGSLITFHFRNKFFGPPPAERKPPPRAAKARPSGLPGRPLLRPPGAL